MIEIEKYTIIFMNFRTIQINNKKGRNFVWYDSIAMILRLFLITNLQLDLKIEERQQNLENNYFNILANFEFDL